MTSCSQQLRLLTSKWAIKALFLWSMKHWLFYHSIKLPDDSWVEIRLWVAHKARQQQQRWWLSWVQNTTVWPSSKKKLNTVNLIEFRYHSYQSIERDHQSKYLSGTESSCSWILQHQTPNPQLTDDFWVRTDMTTYMSYTTRAKNTYRGRSIYEWSTLTATNVYWSKVHLFRRQHTIDALLLSGMSAQSKCTYVEDTLRFKDIEDEKLSVRWIEHIEAIHRAVWSAFVVTVRHISTDQL